MSEDAPKPASGSAEVEDDTAVKMHRARIAEAYGQIEKPLLLGLQSRVGSMQEAREIAQEAWLRVWTMLTERSGTVDSLQALLWTVAQNIAKDRWRQRTYRKGRELILASEAESTSPSPESACIARQRLAIVQAALNELPAKCRLAFVLLFFEDREFIEIAEHMGIDVSGVRKYVARAVAHCQGAIDAAEKAKRSDI